MGAWSFLPGTTEMLVFTFKYNLIGKKTVTFIYKYIVKYKKYFSYVIKAHE
jgi:hypothetical protein